MAKKESNYRTINTVDGITIHLFEDDSGNYKPHCATGPAMIYSKSHSKPDEYYLYGIKYTYDKWLELSRPLRRTKVKEDFID